ncbi:MAG: pilin [bacterium]
MFNFNYVFADGRMDTGGDKAKTDQTASDGKSSTPPPSLDNPLGENVTIPGLIGRIIKAILGVVGSIALAMFVYGGIIWMTSAGNNEMVQRGRDILIWASVGLVTIFGAYSIVSFIFEKGLA